MNWKRKNKSAWALYVPDSSQYNFFPIYQILGNLAFEKIFLFNLICLKKVIFALTSEKNQNADIFIYADKEISYDGIKISVFFKTHFPGIKFKFRSPASIPNLNKTDNGKAPSQEALQKLSYPFHSIAGKMKGIIESLGSQYNQVTVWNLESPLLNSQHFLNTIRPGELLKISGSNERLILLSYRSQIESAKQDFPIINLQIPSFFDLNSIKSIICHLNNIDNFLTEKVAEELAELLESILPNSQD